MTYAVVTYWIILKKTRTTPKLYYDCMDRWLLLEFIVDAHPTLTQRQAGPTYAAGFPSFVIIYATSTQNMGAPDTWNSLECRPVLTETR